MMANLLILSGFCFIPQGVWIMLTAFLGRTVWIVGKQVRANTAFSELNVVEHCTLE